MDLTSQLRAAILAQSLPPPSSTLLTSLTTSRSPPPPLPSLIATAKARLLACDLSSSSLVDSSAPSFPPAAGDAQAAELRLPTNVHVQVVDVENLSLSRWDQIEQLEAVEKGERTRGRRVVRVTAEDDGGDGDTTTTTASQAQLVAPSKNATHRLVLQDRSGKRLFALEVRRIDGISVGTTSMGEKVLLKAGTIVARGTVLLTPETCVLLGGKVEAWQKAWADGRLARLREAVGNEGSLT